MKKQVMIIFGGKSPEYGVSLESATAVIKAVDITVNQVTMVGITPEGQWYEYEGPVAHIASDQWFQEKWCHPAQVDTANRVPQLLVYRDGWQSQAVDVAFPVMHGANGEDGTIQGLLELAGIPYVGCGVTTSALGSDKYLTHRLVASLGIAVTPSIRFQLTSEYQDDLKQFISQVTLPVFVKPMKAGSSYGITQVTSLSKLDKAIELASRYDQEIMVEKAVEGFEVGCGIMGNQSLVVGGVDEIELSHGFFDFLEKYNLVSAKIHSPARISSETRRDIQQQAERVYRGLKCQGLARVDFFLQPDGRLVFNEINTMPGFTEHSRFPNLLKEVGWTYEKVVQHLLELAAEKGENHA